MQANMDGASRYLNDAGMERR